VEVIWQLAQATFTPATKKIKEKGKRVSAGPVKTQPEALKKALKLLRGHGLSVAIEAGNQTTWVYDFLSELGAKVTVVNPIKVKAT